MTRFAIVTSHPVQYYAPWFRFLAEVPGLDVRVFYLWDFGVSGKTDPTFGVPVTWDVPLLDGYAHEFVSNVSRRPGTHHFWGLNNPDLPARLSRFDPSAVLCIGYNYATFARLLLARPQYPLFLRGDSHRLVPPTGIKARVKAAVLRRVFRRFAGFLYVGQANRDYYRLHGVPDDRLFFSPHAVDGARFSDDRERVERAAAEWRRDLGIAPDDRVVLFAGKFEAKKRPLDLLAAFRRAALSRTALLFVGSGPLESELRRAAEGVGSVYFAPFQNQSQMPRVYAAADLLVLPSVGAGETWGLCVNEAMCLGRPALVSSHVGCGPDLVTPGETGWVFPAGDVSELADRLTQACADGARLRRYGAAAYERIQRYSYTAATDGVLRCVEELAGRRPSGRTAKRSCA